MVLLETPEMVIAFSSVSDCNPLYIGLSKLDANAGLADLVIFQSGTTCISSEEQGIVYSGRLANKCNFSQRKPSFNSKWELLFKGGKDDGERT